MHANVGVMAGLKFLVIEVSLCKVAQSQWLLAFPGTNLSYTYSVMHELIHFIYFN